MSTTKRGYKKGPVCGVDNCPSVLWKQIDGHPVCQYGHVNTSSVEINDEEENREQFLNRGAYSRRLTNVSGMTQSAKIRQRKDEIAAQRQRDRMLIGAERDQKLLNGYQVYLKKLALRICEIYNIDSNVFLKVIKRHWTLFLIHHSKKSKSSSETKVTNETNIIPEYENYELGDMANVDMVIICHISLVYMNLPIFLTDLIRMIHLNKIPFLKILNELPLELRIKSYKNKFAVFTKSDIKVMFHKTQHIIYKLGVHDCFQKIEIPYFVLLTKWTLRLNLPLEIILLSNKAVIETDLNLTLFDSKFSYRETLFFRNHPESRLLGIFLTVTRLYFIQNPMRYPIWYQLYKDNKKLRSEGRFGEHQTVDLLNFIQQETNFENLLNWTPLQKEHFLTLYQTSFLPTTEIPKDPTSRSSKMRDVKDKRLYEIFKYDPSEYSKGAFGADLEAKEQRLKDYKESLVLTYTHLYKDDDEILNPDISTDETPESDKDAVVLEFDQMTQLKDILHDEFNVEFNYSALQFHSINVFGETMLDKLVERPKEKREKVSRFDYRKVKTMQIEYNLPALFKSRYGR